MAKFNEINGLRHRGEACFVVKIAIVQKTENFRTLGLGNMRIVRNVLKLVCLRERGAKISVFVWGDAEMHLPRGSNKTRKS